MRKILVVTGTRAEYGILYPVLKEIKKHKGISLILVAGGMHLSKKLGYTIDEIKKDGFKINGIFKSLLPGEELGRIGQSIGIGILELIKIFKKTKPDIVLITGDREEAFSAAVASACMNIPLAHMSGGEVGTGGHIDESIRHAITKFANIHFATSKKSQERILKMGEEKWRAFNVGSASIDTIFHEKLLLPAEVAKKFSLDLSKPVLLTIIHPLSLEFEKSYYHAKEILEAIKELGYQTIVIYPNSDPGGKKIIKAIKEYEKFPFVKTFKNIPHQEYISLMKISNVMVGNSSSGIIEAPSFKLSVVNVGSRQEGRERAKNVIDVGYDKKEIIKAVKIAMSPKFMKIVKNIKSPYGNGTASKKIVGILSKIKINQKLLHKKITY